MSNSPSPGASAVVRAFGQVVVGDRLHRAVVDLRPPRSRRRLSAASSGRGQAPRVACQMSRLRPPFGRPAARTIATAELQVGDRAAGLRFQCDEQPVIGRAVTEPGETFGGRLPRFAGERSDRYHVSGTDRVRKFEGELLAVQAVGRRVAPVGRPIPEPSRSRSGRTRCPAARRAGRRRSIPPSGGGRSRGRASRSRRSLPVSPRATRSRKPAARRLPLATMICGTADTVIAPPRRDCRRATGRPAPVRRSASPAVS